MRRWQTRPCTTLHLHSPFSHQFPLIPLFYTYNRACTTTYPPQILVAPAAMSSTTPIPPSTCNLTIIPLLGPPGAGKSTLCTALAASYPSLHHISIGSIMRAESQNPASPFAAQIRETQRLGRLGDMQVTVGVLRRHLEDAVERGCRAVVLDGG